MQQFKIKEAFILNVAGAFTTFDKGTYSTEDEAEIKALKGSKGAVLVEAEKPQTKKTKAK